LLSIAVARGLLVPVAGWSLSQSVDVFEPWCLGAIVGLFTFGAAATKDFADIEGDRAYGCRTLPVVLGPRQAARLIALFLWVPFGLYPLFAWAGWLTPSVSAFAVLGVALTLLGGATGVSLMRAPTATAGGRNHTAWAMMYLLMLGAHAGVALVYRGA
jgi:4-hydroxybenzoate polyprenyltransferase